KPPVIAQNPTPPPRVETPPPDAAKVLARVLSSPLRQQAVLVDPGQQANPAATDTRVNLGEPLFGGTLVYVHPRGVVSERDGVLRFHAIGVPLQQAQQLNEIEH